MHHRKIIELETHPEAYVTASDLADYWRVSRKQIYKQIDSGTLKAVRLGPRLLRINTADAIRFEERAKMQPPSSHQTVPRRADDHVAATAAGRGSNPVRRRECRRA